MKGNKMNDFVIKFVLGAMIISTVLQVAAVVIHIIALVR
jgi:hypothetical protein